MRWRDQWEDIARHRHPVTIGDVFDLHYADGRVRSLDKTIPKILPEDRPPVALRKAARSIWLRLLQLPERVYWRYRTRRVRRDFQAPHEIRRKMQADEIMPHEDPFINDYAFFIDLFAAEYGWPEKQIRKIPFAAVNEFVLAIEYRHMKKRVAIAIAAHPGDESAEFLSDYPKRDIPITAEMRAYVNRRRIEQNKRSLLYG
jgi:hypothetical protein